MEILAKNEALRLFAFHLAEEMLPCAAQEGVLTVHSTAEHGGFVATATLGEHTCTEHASLAVHFTEKRAENVAVGKALFSLFSALHATPVPYGTLVGVRPAKIAAFYLSRGVSPDETRRILQEEYHLHEKKARLITSLALLEEDTARSLSQEDALLYVSIPFCPSRCRYCSFISHSAPKQLATIPRYLLSMQRELSATAELLTKAGRRIRALYIGGGTPGILSAEQLSALLSHIKCTLPFSEQTEFCVELGRPDTITEEKCAVLADFHIDRVCINPQSLNDSVLRENGRCHNSEDFFRAFDLARRAKLPSINTDLIAGLSGDTPASFSDTLSQILHLSPENVTVHALCKKRAAEEEHTAVRDTEHQWSDAIESAFDACINDGYTPYYLYRQKHTIANMENLGYTKPSHACLYNIAMMEDLCDVFAVGAGAMTKLRKKTAQGYQMIRLPAYKYPAEYLADEEKGLLNLKRALQLLTE